MEHSISCQANRILIVDDNISIHHDFCKILLKKYAPSSEIQSIEATLFGSETQPIAFGAFEIDCASQGKEGLVLLQKAKALGRPYSLAFVDGRMPPGWDGIETISHLWQECPDLQVVLCTAYSDYSWQEIRSVLGETSNLLILKKPFDNVEVLQLVHALTRKWELNRKVKNQVKRLDALMQESENRYRTMMESMKDSVYICSSDFLIEYMNPRMITRIGRDATGECCHKAIYGNENKCSWCISDTVQQGEHVDYEMVNSTDDRCYFLVNSPIYNLDGRISKLTISHDITENKSIEAQLNQARKMESIGTLAGGIAHDFNNMLHIITGNVELAMEDVPKWNPVYANLKDVKDASLRAAGIVKQLLNFSRKMAPELKSMDVVAAVKDSLKFLCSTIPSSIEIQTKFSDPHVMIHGDLTQIQQMLMNLCINASQAMEESGGVLNIVVEKVILDEKTIRSHANLTSGDWLKITVSDKGPGIEPDIIERIFDPYFTTKGVGKGSGMGLAVVHGIIKNHHGAIFVDNDPGKGATFSIFIPVSAEQFVEDVKTLDEIFWGSGEKILCVDDESSIADMIEMMLKRLGYVVDSKTSPVDALELFRLNPDAYDLVLTDMTMPSMTGVKFSEQLKALRRDIPVIICTGHSASIDENTAKSLGVDGYVMKPVVMRDIAKTIRDALDERKNNISR